MLLGPMPRFPARAVPLSAGIEKRIDALAPEAWALIKSCEPLWTFLPAAIDFLTREGNGGHNEDVAHFLMGKVNYLPEGLQALNPAIPPEVKKLLAGLLRTHRWGVVGRAESTQKTISKLQALQFQRMGDQLGASSFASDSRQSVSRGDALR